MGAGPVQTATTAPFFTRLTRRSPAGASLASTSTATATGLGAPTPNRAPLCATPAAPRARGSRQGPVGLPRTLHRVHAAALQRRQHRALRSLLDQEHGAHGAQVFAGAEAVEAGLAGGPRRPAQVSGRELTEQTVPAGARSLDVRRVLVDRAEGRVVRCSQERLG